MNDKEIIKLISEKSYNKVVKNLYGYFPVIKKYIIKNSGTKSDAEDIFQDALLVLFKKTEKGNFELTSSLNTFLFGISRNLWKEQLRKNKKEVYSTVENQADVTEDFSSATEEYQKSKKAVEALSQLGEKCKQLLHLFYYKKLSMAEIASKLGFAGEKGAKNQKYRCLEKAKEIYSSLN
ncbi:MAG: polymerase, sigma-24 subunit, subfamily [Bacteroidetes bacterium]|jgi:RNA polymerase sigma factor (sigma-70 family)|nr:polymerase, sigma-24 subunit, subfamily [Bacteroidota bacterium]